MYKSIVLFYTYLLCSAALLFASEVKSIDAIALQQQLMTDSSIIIVDTRSKSAYYKSHITGAVHFMDQNLDRLIEDKEQAKTKTFIVYCNERCTLSKEKYEEYEKLGLHALNLTGGIDAWKEQGFNITAYGFNLMTAEHLKHLLQTNEDFILLDLRDPMDFIQEHIQNAQSIFDNAVKFKDKHKLIVIYSDGNMPSENKQTTFFKQNFDKVFYLEGGFSKWKRKGYPTDSILRNPPK